MEDRKSVLETNVRQILLIMTNLASYGFTQKDVEECMLSLRDTIAKNSGQPINGQ